MKRDIITILFLIFILGIFTALVYSYKNTHEVLEIINADKIIVDMNNNGIIENNETICIEDIESFDLQPSKEFEQKYSQKYNISSTDMVNLWYLSREYAIKTLQNQKVSLKLSKKENTYCRYGKIKINGTDYSELLFNSGFGIKNGQIGNLEKFNQNVKYGKSLNLVLLNHHSEKYHKLDCKYGKMAHDKVIIPLKQLPKGMKPCRYCHNISKNKKKFKSKTSKLTYYKPPLTLTQGNITLYKFDYTKHLKPDGYCANEVCRHIIRTINNAKSTIDIALYGYEDVPAFTNAIKNAKNRGVIIRFVYDEGRNVYYRNNYLIAQYASQVNTDKSSNESTKLMHNKFIIIDNQIVITGSMNYSKNGLSGYNENDIIFINSSDIAKLYTYEFEQMLNGKFHNAKEKHNQSNVFSLNGTEIEVYFSPQDKASDRIITLINNSNSYIYMPTFLITHNNIAQALINANKRGVDVKIIIDANSVNTKNTKHKLLRDNGINLKAENYAGKLHSKSIVIDDKYVIAGSMNFSNSGENKNDENMLIIKNTQIAKNYRSFFLYLWDLIPNKYLKYSPRAESFDSIGSCNDGVDNNFDGKIDAQDIGCIKK